LNGCNGAAQPWINAENDFHGLQSCTMFTKWPDHFRQTVKKKPPSVGGKHSQGENDTGGVQMVVYSIPAEMKGAKPSSLAFFRN